mgnify:CR=1 FL=1
MLVFLLAFGGIGCSKNAGSNPLPSATEGLEETAVSPSLSGSSPTVVPSDSPETPKSIQWLRDWDEALRRAQAQNKPIMVNFYTDVCPYCRKLDQNTFTDASVIALVSERFIAVKSNAGKSLLYRDYNIGPVPTTVFTRPNGEEIGRIIGYYPAQPFRQGIEEAWNLWAHPQE